MQITNARKDTQGDWKFDLNLKDDEVDFLVNISIHSLLKIGIVSIQEQNEVQNIDILSAIKTSPRTKVH